MTFFHRLNSPKFDFTPNRSGSKSIKFQQSQALTSHFESFWSIVIFNFSPLQGLMFGYATDETEECMPLTVVLAHNLNKKLSDLRRDGTLWWARPDTKTQVTCEYKFDNGACVPTRVHTIVVSTQHSEKVTLPALREDIMEKVVKTVIPAKYLDDNTKYHINPCGNFVIGGPMGDAGLTGKYFVKSLGKELRLISRKNSF